jgi:hypothetical protein
MSPFSCGLIERDPDPFFLAPDNTAGKAQSIRDQREVFRDSNGAGHVQSCASRRLIANHAIYRAAAEFNRSGLQNAMT